MISRHTCSVPKEDVVFPGLLYCDSRCSQACRRRPETCRRPSQACRRPFQICRRPSQMCRQPSQVLPQFPPALRGVLKLITITPMVLLSQLSETPVTLKAGRNALLGSDTLLKLNHLSLHSTSSQTLLESSSD